MLPLKDGFQVYRILKADQTTKDIPVIFLTVLRAEEKATQTGAEAFLLKPPLPETILTKIEFFIKKVKQGEKND